MNGLADVDGFKICIQVCVWLGFPPLKLDGGGGGMIWGHEQKAYSNCKRRSQDFPVGRGQRPIIQQRFPENYMKEKWAGCAPKIVYVDCNDW